MIVSRFDDIIRSKTEGSIINDLPFEEFHDLVSSENLNVSEEYEVVKVINRYLNHRKTLPLLEEEDPA